MGRSIQYMDGIWSGVESSCGEAEPRTFVRVAGICLGPLRHSSLKHKGESPSELKHLRQGGVSALCREAGRR